LSFTMKPTSIMDSPPPASYLSLEEFDQKTSQAMQNAPEVDEDGWEVYDPAAFEPAPGNHERSPPSSSSARIPGSDANRHERQHRRSSGRALPSTSLKIRTCEQNSEHEDDRVASPPPPFTPTGPSLDGPPFEEVVGSSYLGHGPDSTATPILEPYPPSPRSPSPPRRVLPPVEPLRLRPNRLPNSQLQTSSNPDFSHRPISPRPNPTSTIARVDFDPQTAYSPYGGSGANHTRIRADATAFYNHAVASQLTASSAVTAQTQPVYMERVSSSYSGGYTPTTWAQQATSSVSLHEQYALHVHNLDLGVPAVPPGVSDTRSSTPGTVRGSLPPVPNSLSQFRWAGSEQKF